MEGKKDITKESRPYVQRTRSLTSWEDYFVVLQGRAKKYMDIKYSIQPTSGSSWTEVPQRQPGS